MSIADRSFMQRIHINHTVPLHCPSGVHGKLRHGQQQQQRCTCKLECCCAECNKFRDNQTICFWYYLRPMCSPHVQTTAHMRVLTITHPCPKLWLGQDIDETPCAGSALTLGRGLTWVHAWVTIATPMAQPFAAARVKCGLLLNEVQRLA